jgi:hypothetical protein
VGSGADAMRRGHLVIYICAVGGTDILQHLANYLFLFCLVLRFAGPYVADS